MDATINKSSITLKVIDESIYAFLNELLHKGFSPNRLRTRFVPSLFQTQWIEDFAPEHWQIVKMKEVIKSYSSGFASGERLDEGVIQVRMNNIDDACRIQLDDYIRVPTNPDQVKKYGLLPKDVLFNHTNSPELVGKSILWEGFSETVVFSNHFFKLNVVQELIMPEFLWVLLRYYFKLGFFQHRCQRWINQAAMPAGDLLSLIILLPPLNEQSTIVESVFALDEAFTISDHHLSKQNQLKSKLLQNLFGYE